MIFVVLFKKSVRTCYILVRISVVFFPDVYRISYQSVPDCSLPGSLAFAAATAVVPFLVLFNVNGAL